MQLEALITHKVENARVNQRIGDGYIDATAMCKAVGKEFHDYSCTGPTRAFLAALATSTGISGDLLVIVVNKGVNEMRGTWVHPKVAVNLDQWCSPEFAVAGLTIRRVTMSCAAMHNGERNKQRQM